MKTLLKETRKVAFSNGLTLLMTQVSTSALVSFNLCLGMGNLHEKEGERGLSALMMEVMTKGTRQKTAEMLASALESLGAFFDATSGYFAGRLRVAGPSECIDQLLPLFFEIALEPAFRQEEAAREKQYLQNLLRSLDDEPLRAATARFQKAFYGGHPFAVSQLGLVEDLADLTADRLREWYGTVFQPGNMVVSVAGNFRWEQVEQAFGENLGTLSSGLVFCPDHHSKEGGIPEYLERKSIRDCWLVYGKPAPPLSDPSSRAAFDILNAVLGGGLFSRLYMKIREERGLSYQVGSIYVPLAGPSFYCAFAGFSPQHYHEVLSLLRQEMEDLGRVGSEEFQEAKNYTLGSYLRQLEGVQSLTALLAFYEKAGLGWEHLVDYEAIIRETTLEQAVSLYQAYHKENGVLGGVVPREGKIAQKKNENFLRRG